MRTRTVKIALLFVSGSLLLASCGESSEPASQSATPPPPPPILGGDTTPQAGTPAVATTMRAAPARSTVPLRASTPQEAFQTFVDRLKAYDIAGAAELCDPDDPNTAGMEKIATNLQLAAAESGMSMDFLQEQLLNGIETVIFEVAQETDTTAVVRVTAPREKTYELVKLADGWRVRVPDKAQFPHQ